MLEQLRRLLTPESRDAASDDASPTTTELCIAALLISVVRADFETSESELRMVRRALERLTERSGDAIDELMSAAEKEAASSVSLYDFTAIIHRELEPSEKQEVMQQLWKVAFADGRVDAHEEHLLRKVAGLLHLPHREFIAAKQQARRATSG